MSRIKKKKELGGTPATEAVKLLFGYFDAHVESDDETVKIGQPSEVVVKQVTEWKQQSDKKVEGAGN